MQVKNKNIEQCIIRLLSDIKLNYQYFGEFLLYVNFIKNNSIPTAGVNISFNGINFYYNDDFINSLNDKQVMFVMLHELMHLMNKHQLRTTAKYNHELSNIVQDMIINTTIVDKSPKDLIEEPNITPYYVPEKYEGKLIFEELYEWVEKNKAKKNKINLSDAELIDTHLEDEVDVKYTDAIISDVKNTLKNKGIIPGNASVLLDNIPKSKKDYISTIKKCCSILKGSYKQRNWFKPNRYGIKTIKGNVKKSKEITVLLDTSGSMYNSFEKILSTINENNITFNIVLIDTIVQDIIKIKNKNQLQKLNIKGLGGTILQPGINYINSHKTLKKLPMLVLTDGYCDSLDFSKNKTKALIISCGIDVDIIGNKNKVKQILLTEKEYNI